MKEELHGYCRWGEVLDLSSTDAGLNKEMGCGAIADRLESGRTGLVMTASEWIGVSCVGAYTVPVDHCRLEMSGPIGSGRENLSPVASPLAGPARRYETIIPTLLSSRPDVACASEVLISVQVT